MAAPKSSLLDTLPSDLDVTGFMQEIDELFDDGREVTNEPTLTRGDFEDIELAFDVDLAA
jgi:hypothetical protein